MWDNPDRLYRSGCHLSAFLLNRLLNTLLSFPHQVGKGLQPWRNVLGGKGRKEKLNICLEVGLNWQGVGGCYIWTLSCSGLQLLAYALRNSLLFIVFCMCAALKLLLLHLSHFRKGTNSSLARTCWLAGWSWELEGDTRVFCFGVFFSPLFLFLFAWSGSREFTVFNTDTRDLIPGSLWNGPFWSAALHTVCVYRNGLAMSTESSWGELGAANYSRPTCFQGQSVCPSWQGLICLRMHHPSVHSTLVYSICLPSCYQLMLGRTGAVEPDVTWLYCPSDPKSSLRLRQA